MDALEQDLQQSQKNIVEWLTLYEKASEDIISLNFNTQLYSILDAISCFDPQKIRQIEAHSNDEVVLRHLSSISLKIKNINEQGQPPPVVAPPAQKQIPKRQSRIAEKVEEKKVEKKEVKKEGFINSMIGRFMSKEKKSYQIILPEKEPNCYWDEKRRIWIFEGEQPEAPKQIPKPPSKSQRVKVEEPKKQPVQATELDSLTAPPTFRRRTTSSTNTKGKSKIKEEVQVAPTLDEEPMNFAKVLKNITNQYNELLEKVRKGFYQRHIPEVHVQSEQELSEFIGIAQRLLSSSEEIAQQEHKFIQKWSKSILTEPNELKILEKVAKQFNESATIYQLVNDKLDDMRKESYSQKKLLQQSISELNINEPGDVSSSHNIQNLRLSRDLERTVEDRDNALTTLSLKTAEHQMLQERFKQKSQQNQHLFAENLAMKQKIQELKREIEQRAALNASLNQRLEVAEVKTSGKLKEEQKLIEQLKASNKQLEEELQGLKKEKQAMKNEIMELNILYRISQANVSNNNDKQNEQVMKEKMKIQSQLRFYEQKQKSYLANIKSMQDHTSFIYEFQQTLQQENNLLNTILEKRLQLGKVAESEEPFNIYKMQEDAYSPHSVILQLSDIINSITQTHLDRLQFFNRNYSHLNKKYQETKDLLKKLKSNASTENISLNRSVTKLKSLIETYKTAKEDSEEKCKLLEIECEKLKRKVEHFKEEDKFNKSYLTKLKSSRTVNNQNDSIISLQEDNEELAQTIEDLQNEVGRKDENYTKLSQDLEDLLSHYQKNQTRLANIEKKHRQNEKEVRLLKDEKQELINKINLLQVKLANQKEKNEEMIRHDAAKWSNMQATHEKKIKVLTEDLHRLQQSQEDLREEIQEMRKTHKRKINQLETMKSNKEIELMQKIREKQTENGELLMLIEDANEKVEEQAQTIRELKEKTDELESRQLQIANSIHDFNSSELITLKQAQKVHNEMITSLLFQYKSFEEQEYQFRRDCEDKISYLSQELLQSNAQSEKLLADLEGYTVLVNTLDLSIKEMQARNEFAKSEQQRVIQKLQIENGQLTELVTCLQDEIEIKKQEIGELQILSEKISAEVETLKGEKCELEKAKQDLMEKLSNIEKQMQIKESEITNKSQSLLIKSQELDEKNEILIEQEENLVLTKEELEGLRNQIKQKNLMIARLNNDLQLLAQELAKQDEQDNVVPMIPDGQKFIVAQEINIKQLITSILKRNVQPAEWSEALDECKKAVVIWRNVEKKYSQLLERSQIDSLDLLQRQNRIIKLEKQLVLNGEINKQLELQIQNLRDSLDRNINPNDKILDEKDEEVQSEIEYLLKEIEDRENQNNELQSRIKDLEKQLLSVMSNAQGNQEEQKTIKHEEKVSKSEEKNKKQQEVEGEMEYLLKQIEEREMESNKLKDHIICLEKDLQEAEAANSVLSQANIDFQVKLKQQLKQNEINLEQKIKYKRQIELLEKQKTQLTELIEDLSKQIEKSKLEVQGVSGQTEQLIAKLSQDVKEKSKALTDLHISKQQVQRLLFLAQNEKKESQDIINDLQNKIVQLAEIVQSQEEVINKQDAREEENISSSNNMESKIAELEQARSKVKELSQALVNLSTDYEQKIESLQKEIISLNSLRTTNKKLQDSLKVLQLQNSDLLNEKADLMRGIDNLTMVNQKLITQMSPHNKMNTKSAQKIEKPISQQKEQSKQGSNKEIKEDKQEPKGFFGAISSLFLTPTESERLGKK